MNVRLICLNSGTPRLHILLDRLPVVIGRNADADVRVVDQWVSRVHCEISEIEGTLVVRDLDSRNGTLVNGQYIREAHLLPGDRLTVGLNNFEVRYKRSPRRSMSGVAVGQC
jgi:pSer/pThr/pTyr-binding forkhead associated (FHA) protein